MNNNQTPEERLTVKELESEILRLVHLLATGDGCLLDASRLMRCRECVDAIKIAKG